MSRGAVGLDLGQAQDYSAVVVVDRAGAELHVRLAHRFPLGMSYPDIVERAGRVMRGLPEAALVVDATGVGAPVVDMLRKARLRPIPVTITGGNQVTRDPSGGFHVPKRDLVSAAVVPLQNGVLKFAAELEHLEALQHELLSFRTKINAAGHDTYAAWREQDHDDLVLALALACWWLARPQPWARGPVKE